MARAAKTRGSIGAQGEVTRGRSKWSTETFSLFETSQEARDKKQETRSKRQEARGKRQERQEERQEEGGKRDKRKVTKRKNDEKQRRGEDESNHDVGNAANVSILHFPRTIFCIYEGNRIVMIIHIHITTVRQDDHDELKPARAYKEALLHCIDTIVAVICHCQ